MPAVLGLDIGGANLKAATSTGQAVTMPFPLWKQPNQISGSIAQLVRRLPTKGPVAVTMTGELCDCFPNKTAGVRHILAEVETALRERPVFVWRNDGKWASIRHAQDEAEPVAAANWLASATYAGRYLTEGAGWFFDLGSTTLDMIPMLDGKPVAKGKTDLERLKAGELAYLGAAGRPSPAWCSIWRLKKKRSR
ncbi:MAG: hydantoinase/oxoprolinase family protein [Gemmatales bacterium]